MPQAQETPAPAETADVTDALADVSLEEMFAGDDAGTELLDEGTEADERSSDATAADATQVDKPATPAEGTETADDPEVLLATATPLDFTVNGESKTFDGIQVIPGHGAIINEDALPGVRDLLQKGQQAWDANRELYQETERYRALEYTSASGEASKGLDAFASALTDNARLNAAVKVFADTLGSPDRIAALIADPTAYENLKLRLENATERASATARTQWGERVQRTTEGVETQPDRLTAMLGSHIDSLKSYVPQLTQADWNEAKTIFGPFATQIVRRATPDDARAAGVKVGSLVVDNSRLTPWLEARATARSAEATAKAAADKTDAENKRRLAAANAGKKTTQQRRSASAAQPQQRRESDSDRKAREWAEQRNRMVLDGVVGSTVTDE
jgi:hypothetical protein